MNSNPTAPTVAVTMAPIRPEADSPRKPKVKPPTDADQVAAGAARHLGPASGFLRWPLVRPTRGGSRGKPPLTQIKPFGRIPGWGHQVPREVA